MEPILKSLSNKYNLDENLFFKNLPTTSPKTLASMMAPFYFAVKYWSTHLEELVRVIEAESKCDNDTLVKIKENILDEKGDSIESDHVTTFINFLISLHPLEKQLESNESVNTFIGKLKDLFKMSNEAHLAALGGIEYLYIDISNRINNYCIDNKVKIYHYKVHSIIDHKHAHDFFSNSSMKSCDIEVGFSMIYEVFNCLWVQHNI